MSLYTQDNNMYVHLILYIAFFHDLMSFPENFYGYQLQCLS